MLKAYIPEKMIKYEKKDSFSVESTGLQHNLKEILLIFSGIAIFSFSNGYPGRGNSLKNSVSSLFFKHCSYITNNNQGLIFKKGIKNRFITDNMPCLKFQSRENVHG